MKATLYILAFIACFLFIARMHITFSPFKISFGSLWLSIGWLFLSIGVLCIGCHYHNEGKKEAYKEINEMVERIEKLQNFWQAINGEELEIKKADENK